jgi:acetyl-CoA carboxylase biotin carboxyl carrier protein
MVKYYPAMAKRELTYEDLVRIVELVKTTSHFSEFRLKVGEIEVSLRRAGSGAAPQQPAPSLPQGQPSNAPAAQPAVETARKSEKDFAAGLHLVRSPMVGTFYRRPEPTKPPFVEPGQKVEPDTTVCIIEVMKLMNSIPAGVRGTVREVVVDNAAPVEQGEVLMAIEPGR